MRRFVISLLQRVLLIQLGLAVVAKLGTLAEVGTLTAMRRFVILLLICVLPLQFALAASVDALEHASGEHPHDSASRTHAAYAPHAAHLADAGDTPDAADVDDSSTRSHAECAACHCFHLPAMLGTHADFRRAAVAALVNLFTRDDRHRSAAAERPERPNWSALV